MKRMLTVGGVVLLLVFGWRWIDTDRLFADVYYAKVPVPDTAEQGAAYTYEVIAYDGDGKKRPLTFRSAGRLGEGEFLKMYVKDEHRVTAYEPAVEHEVPSALKDEQTDEPVTIPLP